jgi:thiosulfate dehydrogenase
MTVKHPLRTLSLMLLAGILGFAAGVAWLQPPEPASVPAATAAVGKAPFAPPAESTIPDDAFGREVELGRRLFTDTAAAAPQFVGNDLKCSNCHLDAGRLADSAPMWAAYVLFPQYRRKNDHVNTFQERIQGCFRYSMNGMAPPLGDPVLVALESYAAFLSTGAPMGTKLPGAGYPELAPPPLRADRSRGRAVYVERCALCHGEDGAGQRAGGTSVFPPLWGDRSYNWGAGMSDIDKAARFIKANMPFSQGGTLSDQQAWDVAAYLDGKPRPQDPRYTGTVEQTRARFHDTPQSLYGTSVEGVLLGGDGPPRPFAGRPIGPARGS